MRAINQGGSLAGFIIIGVLLTLVFVGGLYGLNRYNAEKATDEAIAANEADKKKAAEEEKRQSESSGEASEEERTMNDEEAAPATPSPAPMLEPQPSSTQPATQLPQTGPADNLLALAVIGLVTFAGTHYVRSRA